MTRRLTDDDVREILLAPVSVPISDLAAKLGVSAQPVRSHKRLETDKARRVAETIAMERERLMVEAWDYDSWEAANAHIVHVLPAADDKRHNGQLTDAQVREIRNSKTPSTKLAEALRCSSSLIRMVRTGKAYTHVKD